MNSLKKTQESSEQQLIDKKINPTAMRLLIYNHFLNEKNALSLSDIENVFDTADRTTIYRTLKVFEQKGLLHTITENNSTRYLLCHNECSEGNHHDIHVHFLCTNCMQTSCLEDLDLSKLALPKNYRFDEFQFLTKGICNLCLETLQ